MKIAAYCRVSTEKEAQIDSLEKQIEFFNEFTQKNGYELYKLYADEGISGKQIKNRKQFQQMMKDAKAKKFERVVVKDVSRFARNTVDLLQSIRELKSYGIQVDFLNNGEVMEGGSEFILTILGAMAQQESANMSKRVKFGKDITAKKGRVPNLVFGYDKIPGEKYTLKINEEEAKEIALAIELFTNGSLNTFAMNTNVNTSSSLICYDILDLGKQLLPIGMLVVLDSILNRITANRTKGKNTYIFIDEIYLLFQYEYSANFLFTLWKRVRKYGAFCTGITQNVEDLLQSHTARTMLANSEFIIMLNQASTDRIELAKLLNISDLQMSYITNVGAGEGLIKVGSSLVPFSNRFPKNTELYKLMTTKPGEGLNE